MDKKKFLIKYTLLYTVCLFFSLGLGFVLASVSVDSGLWQYAVPALGLLLLIAVVVALVLANVMYKKMERELAARKKNPYKK